MAIYPWRFQADLAKGEADPSVTVFVGPERQKLDDKGELTGETFVEQLTTNPVTCKLSELATLLAQGAIVRSP